MQPPKKIIDALQDNNSFLAHAHLSPDPDSIGSVLALKLGLESVGKKLTLFCEEDLPDVYSFLPSISSINKDELDKAINGNFDAYLSIDTAAFKLATFHKPIPDIPFPLINIDHHPDNEINNAAVSWIEESAASASEMIYHLLQALDVTITPQIATCILFGLLGDTTVFHNFNTTPASLRLAADLIDASADYSACILNLSYSKTKKELTAQTVVSSNLKLSPDQSYVIISLGPTQWQQIGDSLPPGVIANQFARSIAHTQFGVVLSEKKPGITKGSIRSRLPDFDVSIIAHQFGGGGHKAAAGFRLELPLAAAQKEFINAVKQLKEAGTLN